MGGNGDDLYGSQTQGGHGDISTAALRKVNQSTASAVKLVMVIQLRGFQSSQMLLSSGGFNGDGQEVQLG